MFKGIYERFRVKDNLKKLKFLDKRLNDLTDNYIHSEKEFWEIEVVRVYIRRALRVVSLVFFLSIILFILFFFYLTAESINIKDVSFLLAAIIAGCFTMLSTIGNTENSVRSLRSKWLDDCRADIAKYLAVCRRCLLVTNKYRDKRLQKERFFMSYEVSGEEISRKELEEVNARFQN